MEFDPTPATNQLTEYYILLLSAFLLVSLGIFLGLFLEKTVKQLFFLQRDSTNSSVSNINMSHVEENTNDSLSFLNGIKIKGDILLPPIEKSKVPKHIGVIMDGNRRFGKLTHADPLKGHWAGGQTLVDFIQWCMMDGISAATVYAFSTENWNRDPMEVSTLMTIFAKYAESFIREATSRNVKVKILSTEFSKLPPKVQLTVKELEEKTANCTGFTLNICLSYGGRQEIVNAVKELCKEFTSSNANALAKDFEDINEAMLSKYMTTKDLPDPDILIRTSGEFRISNFLLWQLAYTELFFVDKLWPQLTQKDLRRILHEYVNRGRRFGK